MLIIFSSNYLAFLDFSTNSHPLQLQQNNIIYNNIYIIDFILRKELDYAY